MVVILRFLICLTKYLPSVENFQMILSNCGESFSTKLIVLDYMSKQSLLLVVLMVTNKHNYELIMFASPMKYSGTTRTLYKNH